jgi:tight adherence protein C
VRPAGLVVGSSIVFVLGAMLLTAALAQPQPPVRRAVARLERLDRPVDASRSHLRRFAGHVASGVVVRAPSLLPRDVDLRLIGRQREAHVLLILVTSASALLGPFVIVGVLHALGAVGSAVVVPAGLGLCGMVAAPAILHAATLERAAAARTDLRHQLSAYLDVVTMLLAGNTGHEGALGEAARAGDGQLFRELQRRTREAVATGRSLVDALDATGRDLGLEELRQVAATTWLSASEGAPVARTLAAKCATLRSTLATEQEAEARLRTGRLTSPIVGMAFIFMALVLYPALTLA